MKSGWHYSPTWLLPTLQPNVEDTVFKKIFGYQGAYG